MPRKLLPNTYIFLTNTYLQLWTMYSFQLTLLIEFWVSLRMNSLKDFSAINKYSRGAAATMQRLLFLCSGKEGISHQTSQYCGCLDIYAISSLNSCTIFNKHFYKSRIVKLISVSCFKWIQAQLVPKMCDYLSRCVDKFRVVLVTKSCVTLVTPWTVARKALLSMGLPRQEYWNGLLFPSQGIFLNQGSQS